MRITGAFPVRWAAQDGKEGKGATYIDLENENASMLYDTLGNIVGGTSGYLYSLCHLYSDGQEVTPVTFTMHEKSSGVSGSVISGNTIKITAITTDTGYFTVKCTYNGETFYKKMTLKRLVGVDKFEIVPEPSAIFYNTSTLQANAATIKVRVYRTAQNGTRTNIGSLPRGFALGFQGCSQKYAYGAQGAYVEYEFDASSASLTEIRFSLSNRAGVVFDAEGVPVNRYSNGTSVIAQFSTGADGQGNWNWHTPYVVGDIWMRTSDDGGTTWTYPLRCVGENGANGAYTDYKFAKSAALTTASPTTAPAISGSWTDAPVATDSTYPYLWMRIQKYNGNGTTKGSATYVRLTGEKGANGTSVSIKGRVHEWHDNTTGYDKVDALVWAINTPHGIYYWSETMDQYVTVTPSAGDGYIVEDPIDPDYAYNRHLLVSNGTAWIDAGVIKGDKGDPTYLHIAYANSADGSVGFTTDDSEADGHAYIGTYVDSNISDSEDYTDYNWVRVRGENGIVYDIVPSVFAIRADSNGNVLTGAIEVLAYKTDGKTRSSNLLSPIHLGEEYYYAQYSIDGGTWTSCTQISVGSGVQAQVAYGVPSNKVKTATRGIAFRLKHSSDNNKVLKTIPEIQVIKNGGQGEQGIEGCIIRKTQWVAGVYFRNDKNEKNIAYRYIDIAIVKGSTPTLWQAFMCKVTHLSTAENAPTYGMSATTEWEPLNNQTPMYTPFLLADYADIAFAQTNRILVFKADGETVAAGMGGAEGGNDDYPLWVGATYQERATAPFRVSLAGKLFATDAEISGKIDAISGSIGGFEISNYEIRTKDNYYYEEGKRGIHLRPWGESQIGCLTTRHTSTSDSIYINGGLTVKKSVNVLGRLNLEGGFRVPSGSYSDSGATISEDVTIAVLHPSYNDQGFYLPRTYSDVSSRFLFIINNSQYWALVQRMNVTGSGYNQLRWDGNNYDRVQIGPWTSIVLVYTNNVWMIMNINNNIRLSNY